MKIVRQYCPRCEENVRAEGPGVNHVLHLLLTILLCGWWAIVWVLLAMSQTYSCSKCGTRTYGSAAELWILRILGLGFVGFAVLFVSTAVSLMGSRTAPPVPNRVEPPRIIPPVQPADPGPGQAAKPEPAQQAPVDAVNPDPEPVKKVDPQPEATKPDPEPAEDPKIAMAARKLTLAKPFVARGDKATAKKRLNEIIKDFPETPAADEAKELLKKLE